MNRVSGVAQVGGIAKRLREIFSRTPCHPEPRYECRWCHDSGFVSCTLDEGRNYPIRAAEVFRVRQQGRREITTAVCRFCDGGTYRGRPVAGSLQSAERWVAENVTTTTTLTVVKEKAAAEGYSELMLDQAFRRCGIRKFKLAGRMVCEPTKGKSASAEVQPYGEFAGFGG